MKRALILFSIAILALSINSCKNNDTPTPSTTPIAKSNTSNEKSTKDQPAEDTTTLVKTQGTLPVNLDKSIVKWRGSMLFSFGEHYGTVNLKNGHLALDNEKLVGGTFTVDMNTIANTDGGYSQDLVDHLKNEDFFDVTRFPESYLKITAVEHTDAIRKKIDASLTIKGITRPVEIFKAEYDKDSATLKVKLKIDRTDWGINYGAKGVTKVKDYVISDVIELEAIIYTNEKH